MRSLSKKYVLKPNKVYTIYMHVKLGVNLEENCLLTIQ